MEKRKLREVTMKTGEYLILREPEEGDAKGMIEYLNTVVVRAIISCLEKMNFI